ncbi:hypothetical protein ACM16X_16345 [Haloarcula japonica]|uniref:hypothetical protein n=1 Tax=Haloarcula japonica TaxID=29282 RepID=UPI0039F6AF6B
MNSRSTNLYFQPRYDSDAQYEQNVTKHLMTVLYRVDNSVTDSLLADLLPEDWGVADQEAAEYEYDIEVEPSDDPDYEEAYILGLSNYRTDLEEVEEDDQDSRADGQITAVDQKGNKSFSIIIEAKTGSGTLTDEELSRYKKHFGASDVATTEWAAVHGKFDDLQVGDEVHDFLIDQYAGFLMNEEMEGVVAESTHTDQEENLTQVNQILIRYEADLSDQSYSLRFLSWYRDSAEEDFVKNYSAWFSAKDFERLFDQVDRDTRYQTFVGVENGEGEEVPSLEPLIDWAEDGGYGPEDGQDDFKGSHSWVVAEIEDRNGHYPELRLDAGESLRFSRLTENASANIRKPTHYDGGEFRKLMLELEPNLRKSVFVDYELEPFWDHYVRRSLEMG